MNDVFIRFSHTLYRRCESFAGMRRLSCKQKMSQYIASLNKKSVDFYFPVKRDLKIMLLLLRTEHRHHFVSAEHWNIIESLSFSFFFFYPKIFYPGKFRVIWTFEKENSPPRYIENKRFSALKLEKYTKLTSQCAKALGKKSSKPSKFDYTSTKEQISIFYTSSRWFSSLRVLNGQPLASTGMVEN